MINWRHRDLEKYCENITSRIISTLLRENMMTILCARKHASLMVKITLIFRSLCYCLLYIILHYVMSLSWSHISIMLTLIVHCMLILIWFDEHSNILHTHLLLNWLGTWVINYAIYYGTFTRYMMSDLIFYQNITRKITCPLGVVLHMFYWFSVC